MIRKYWLTLLFLNPVNLVFPSMFNTTLSGVVKAGDSQIAQSCQLQIVAGERLQTVLLKIEIGEKSFESYWSNTFDIIFDFADSDGDGVITENERKRIPSIRSLRSALGSGFATPVAPPPSIEDWKKDCYGSDRQQLIRYYQEAKIGESQFALGQLGDSLSLTAALLQLIDSNRDGKVTQSEFIDAYQHLSTKDINDDELISVSEIALVPNYPAVRATQRLVGEKVYSTPSSRGHSTQIEWRTSNEVSSIDRDKECVPFVHQFSTAMVVSESGTLPESTVVEIQGENVSADLTIWSIDGNATKKWEQIKQQIRESWLGLNDEMIEDETETRSDRRDRLEWLVEVADRNNDMRVDEAELNRWMDIQDQIARGQLLISIYTGGGLFELIDKDRDGSWSIKECADGWSILESNGCLVDGIVDPEKVREQIYVLVSQGQPSQLSIRRSSGAPEWFIAMDRNLDGSVSKREFTGALTDFERFDLNRDGLIYEDEIAFREE